MHSVRLEPTKLILIGSRTTYQVTGELQPDNQCHGPRVQLIASFFETKLAFRRFWVSGPRHSEAILAEMCYLSR